MKTDVACDKIISACGNDCNACPRHLPKTDEELQKTAELWYRLGFRDSIVSVEKIKCSGCKAGNWCRYDIVDCTAQRNIENCGQCEIYSCSKIYKAFEMAVGYESECRAKCSEEEYRMMHRASLEKQNNLDFEKRKSHKTD